MSGPLLAGIRVVEFGNLIAAPYAGMLLADLGADVVKVEPPTGDLGRAIAPHVGGESVFFTAANRGKKSLAIDPKHPDAGKWLTRLVRDADVVVNNLRRGAMERMGLDEPSLRELNPGVVYAVVSAFGADGPHADRSGIDVVFQAASGMISVTGHPDDPPQKTATTIGDYVAATNAALVVCAALVERNRTGRGRRVDISLRDGLLAVQAGWWSLYFARGSQPSRTGTASPFLAPNQVFEASDGHFALAIVSDRHFQNLCELLDRADLASRFPTNDHRMQERDELAGELATTFARDSVSSWVDRLGAAGLPVGPVLDFAAVEADPQVAHNEMIVEQDHPVAGKIKTIGSPLRVDRRPALSDRPAPRLGEHGRSILAGLGADEDSINRLVSEGALVIP